MRSVIDDRFLQVNSTMVVHALALAFPSTIQQELREERDRLIGRVRSVLLASLRVKKLALIFSVEGHQPLRIDFFNAEGNKTKTVYYGPGIAKSNLTEVYNYDAMGRKSEWIVRQGSMIAKTVYSYGEEKNQTEALETVISGKHAVTRKYVSTFDGQGNQVAATYRDSSGVELKASYHYEYNEDGKIAVIETCDGNGSRYHKIFYIYDSTGELRMMSAFGPDDLLYERSILAYSVAGRREERLTYKHGNLHSKIVYSYDSRQNLIEVAGYNANSLPLGRTTHSLKYDDVGNWIEKVSQSWDADTGKPTSRWIEYQDIRYW